MNYHSSSSSSSSSSLPRRRTRPSVAKRTFAVVATMVVAATTSSNGGVLPPVHAANPISAGSAMDYRYFVAGGTCAAFSHGITTPIDVVKTKLQANPEKYKGKGLIGATVQICRDPDEGPGTLLNGLGPTVLGYGIEGAMKFGVYEFAKPVFKALLGEPNKVVAFMLASFLAGAIASVLLVPMESLRIKQVTDVAYQDDTILTGLPRIIRDDGVWVTMSGVWAMLAKQVPYTFGKQVCFDLVAKFLYSVAAAATTASVLANKLQADQLKWVVSLLSAVCASIAACLCSQPGDMILTETYNTGNNNNNKKKSKSRSNSKSKTSSSSTPGKFGVVVRGIYERGGVPEFYRGTQARLVHVGLIITSQLMVYDLVKQLLGLPATGSH